MISLALVSENNNRTTRAIARSARSKTNYHKQKLERNYPTNLNVHAAFPIRFPKFKILRGQKVEIFTNLQDFCLGYSKFNNEAYSQICYTVKQQLSDREKFLASDKRYFPFFSSKSGLYNLTRNQTLSPILTFRQLNRKQLQEQKTPNHINNHLKNRLSQINLSGNNRFGNDRVSSTTTGNDRVSNTTIGNDRVSSTTTGMTTTENQYELHDFRTANEFEKSVDFGGSDTSLSLSAFSNPSLESNPDEELSAIALEEPHSRQVIGSQLKYKVSPNSNFRQTNLRNGLHKKYIQNETNSCFEKTSNLIEKTANDQVSIVRFPAIPLKQKNDKLRRSKSIKSSATKKAATPTLSEMKKSKSDFTTTVNGKKHDSFHYSSLPLPLRRDIKRLQITKDDLIRRNVFLQKEIEKAKIEIAVAVPQKKLDDVKNKNQELKDTHESTNQNIDDLTSQISKTQQSYNKYKLDLAEKLKQKKSQEALKKRRKQEYQKKTEEQLSLKKIDLELNSKQEFYAKQQKQLYENITSKNLTKSEKEKEKNKVLKELDEINRKTEAEQAASTEAKKEAKYQNDILKNTKNLFCNLEEKLKEAKENNVQLSTQLQKAQENLQNLKSQGVRSTSKLRKLQQEFRKIEEAKLKRKSSHTQTTDCLVIMRDIAWIRVAEEEVLLSPRYGAKGGARRESGNKILPVGAVTPVFEIYNLCPCSHTESISPSKRGNPLRNKRLVDAFKGTEFSWISEHDE